MDKSSVKISQYPQIPEEIRSAAKRGSLVLFIGAGISRLAGLPSWDGFADKIIDQLKINPYQKQLLRTLRDPRKRLSIADILADSRDSFDFDVVLKKNETTDVYSQLNKFECAFVTTNFDRLILPDVSKNRDINSWCYYQSKDILSANLDAPGTVIHLHGCVDSPTSMVITTQDYLRHYSEKSWPRKFLRTLFSEKTVVFLGYGLEEVEILENIFRASENKSSKEIRTFIIQGFFEEEQPLVENLSDYYRNSFSAKLIPFSRNINDFGQQTHILKHWLDQIDFGELNLVDQLDRLRKDLHVHKENALQRVKNTPDLAPWLFNEVHELHWFDSFCTFGYLKPELNPMPKHHGDNSAQIPNWPITDYLVRSSKYIKDDPSYAVKYLELLKSVTEFAETKSYSNYRTWWHFSKILRNLPVDAIEDEYLTCIDYWLKDPFDRYLVNDQISQWINELAAQDGERPKEIAVSLLSKIFTVDRVKGGYYEGQQEAILRMDSYAASKFSKEYALVLGKSLGLKIVEVFKSKLIQVLEINNDDNYSNFWRNSIPDYELDTRCENANTIVLTFFRDSLLGCVKASNDIDHNLQLKELLSSKYEIFQRVGIYLVSECFEKFDDSVFELIIDASKFKDRFRHELWHFLNKNYIQLNSEQQDSVIRSISKLSVKNDKTGYIDEKASAYKRATWFSSIKEFDEKACNLYDDCVIGCGSEPENPDFSVNTKISSVEHLSPITLNEINVISKNPAELVSFLNEYKDTDKGRFDEPGLDGLIDRFGDFISNDDQHRIFEYADEFVKLKPYYLNEILSVYFKLWSDKEQRDWSRIWPDLIAFCSALFSLETFWNSREYNSFIDKHSVVRSFCNLIRDAFCQDHDTINSGLVPKVKKILQIILTREMGESFHADSNAVEVSINSPRGQCLEAMISLASHACRAEQKGSEIYLQIWEEYESIFQEELQKPEMADEYEFVTLAMLNAHQLFHLSREWFEANLETLFGEPDSLRWLCAVQAYAYCGVLYPQINDILKYRDFYSSVLDSAIFSTEIKNRYVDYICLAHINKFENLSDEDSPLQCLLRRGIEAELKRLIWFFWKQRKEGNIAEIRKIILELWPRIFEISVLQTSGNKTLASRLAIWVEYFEEIDQDSFSWLKALAPFVYHDHNGNIFEHQLARLSDKYSIDVGLIWKELLIDPPSFSLDLDPLEIVFRNLIKQGDEGATIAREIADKYVQNNNNDAVHIFNSIFR